MHQAVEQAFHEVRDMDYMQSMWADSGRSQAQVCKMVVCWKAHLMESHGLCAVSEGPLRLSMAVMIPILKRRMSMVAG